MNAFEDIVALCLEEEGFWTKKSVKVNITKTDKREIGSPSMPRPEIDLVAFNVKKNELLLIEAKSYLDSPGVRFSGLTGGKSSVRYKLFNDDILRGIVSKRLYEDYLKRGLIKEDTKINYALAAGKIYSSDEEKIRNYFLEKGWEFISPVRIKNTLKELSNKGWEDSLVTVTAKLVLR